MNKKIISFVKYNKIFLRIYQLMGNLFVAVLRFFLRPNDHRIMFMSFGGQKFDDSPRALYEAMKTDHFFASYEFVWAFTAPDAHNEVDCKKVKVDTLRFYITALTSGIWINNSGAERGLKLKSNNILELDTWHGTPLKKIGNDVHSKTGYVLTDMKNQSTIFCAQSEYDQEIFARFFNVGKEQIHITDLPRNDSLLHYSAERILEIKKTLNLPLDKKIILYAPTFREYERDDLNSCYLKPPIDPEKWKKQLADQYVILFRAHYEVVNVLGIRNDDFFINVSSYPCLNDLIAISDLLISDYSSIYFDYAITGKPMLNFSYDYDMYLQHRGLYLDLEESLPCKVHYHEDTLLEELRKPDYKKLEAETKKFANRFAPNAGNACQKVLALLKERISAKK